MENRTIIRMAIPLVVWGILAVSCSKEKVTASSENNSFESNSINLQSKSLRNGPISYGGLSGIILPLDAKVEISLNGNENISLAIDENGELLKQLIRTGIYTLSIHPLNPEYGDNVINDLQITENSVTDIGVIYLHSLNSGFDGFSGR
jgi:hypothetical protein